LSICKNQLQKYRDYPARQYRW